MYQANHLKHHYQSRYGYKYLGEKLFEINIQKV